MAVDYSSFTGTQIWGNIQTKVSTPHALQHGTGAKTPHAREPYSGPTPIQVEVVQTSVVAAPQTAPTPPLTTQADAATQEVPEEKPEPARSKPVVKRPKRGERKPQILQTLALMLEGPRTERITTAALAERLKMSEAGLYRHFSSKAQMFADLIEFIEESVLGLIRQISQREESGEVQAVRIVMTILQFAEKNPGMARVMAGDALVLEHPDLQVRMLRLYDKVEASLKQCLRIAAVQQASDAADSPAPQNVQQKAHMAVALALGKIHRYVRSEFHVLPTTHIDAHTLRAIFTA